MNYSGVLCLSSVKEWRESFKRYVYFPRTKLNYWVFRKLRSLKTKQVGTKSWDEWFNYVVRDINLTPTIHEQIQFGSAQSLLAMWMQNYAENLPYIRYGNYAQVAIPQDYRQQTIFDLVHHPPVIEGETDFEKIDAPTIEYQGLKVKHAPEGSAVVVGRGPSLFKHEHLKMLAEAINNGSYKGMICASDGGFIPCLENGVIPDVVVTVDGSPIIEKYFDHPLVKEHGPKIKWITSVTVNNTVFLKARENGLQIYWFNPQFDDWRQNESWTKLQRLLSRTEKYDRGTPAVQSGGNCGAAAWILAMELFCRSPIALIGIDMGYPDDTKLEETQYYSSALKIAKGDVAIMKEAYKQFYHPTFKTKAYVDLVFYHYRQAFLEMQQSTAAWYRLYGGTYNCSEGGTLFGQGITCQTFAQFLQEHKT